uniref:Nonstructural protein n=1 Tax=Parvoviridae sp. TaxID=1940570 RepID=A0A7D3QRJ2_9VIRU|nr:MAG: nonstructural protein [Parvoviridae sp.]
MQQNVPNACFFAANETTNNHSRHLHLILSLVGFQRPDSFKRKVLKIFQDAPYIMNLKIQPLRTSLYKMIRYMTKDIDKDTSQFCSGSKALLDTAFTIATSDTHRWKHEHEQDTVDGLEMHPSHVKMVQDFTKSMIKHKTTDLKELGERDPAIITKYAHRNIASVVRNLALTMKPHELIPTIEDQFKPELYLNWGYWKINLFLAYQNVSILEFRKTFRDWILQRDPKKNTIVLHGVSNSGKSAFIKGLKQIFKYGEIVNGSTFMFDNCVNKQLLVWEEPLVGSDSAEKVKQVLEGAETKINIKNVSAQTLRRTPVIITTNSPLWRHCSQEQSAFQNRMTIFSFNKPAEDFVGDKFNHILGDIGYDYTSCSESTRNCSKYIKSTGLSSTSRASREEYWRTNCSWDDITSSWISPLGEPTITRTGLDCQPLLWCDNSRRTCSCELKNFIRANFKRLTECGESSIDDSDRSCSSDRSWDTDIDGVFSTLRDEYIDITGYTGDNSGSPSDSREISGQQQLGRRGHLGVHRFRGRVDGSSADSTTTNNIHSPGKETTLGGLLQKDQHQTKQGLDRTARTTPWLKVDHEPKFDSNITADDWKSYISACIWEEYL